MLIFCLEMLSVCGQKSWAFFIPVTSTQGFAPTVSYLQYLITGSTPTVSGPFQLPTPQSGTLPDFIRDPTISADCFRRLLKTYLLARYWCIQRVRGSWWLLHYINRLTYFFNSLCVRKQDTWFLDRITLTTYLDVVYCYRPSIVVGRSVGLICSTLVSPAKTAKPRNHELDKGSDPPMKRGNFGGNGRQL